MASKFEAEKNIRDSSDWISNLVSEALQNAGFKNIKFDEEENRFYAQTKVSFWSWSEYIEVKIHTNPLQSELKFKSICALFTQIFDWGKNRRNWIRFDKELDKLIISKLISDNHDIASLNETEMVKPKINRRH